MFPKAEEFLGMEKLTGGMETCIFPTP